MSTATTAMMISAVIVTLAWIAAVQTAGVQNATTAVTALKVFVIAETVALIVQQYVLTVTKNVPTVLILISVADVIPA